MNIRRRFILLVMVAAIGCNVSNIAESAGDWPQWGGSSLRNNVSPALGIPTDVVASFDDDGNWLRESSQRIRWVAPLGSQTYGTPVIAEGKVFVGTNNGHGYIKRYPPQTVDLGCLLCFNEADGKFLWQHSNEKLPGGRIHDWPLWGICSTPLVEGDRLWYVNNRAEVVCLDTQGFYDKENDGPHQVPFPNEEDAPFEADVVWSLDMMKTLGVQVHERSTCSITATGDTLWINTGNGVDQSHINIPAPDAPSFIAVDKHTGKVIWTNNSPGQNILHADWSSPAAATLGGVPQVIFSGGDAWLRSFLAEPTPDKPKLLWEFDTNLKSLVFFLGGRGRRNELPTTAVIYKDRVYIAVGQDPEHGEGPGGLWCIDPTKRGDVSSELVVRIDDRRHIVPKRRLKPIEDRNLEISVENPNSAAVWYYDEFDRNGDGKVDFEETMHRTLSSAVVKDDLLYIPDFSGLVHCVDAITGKPYWTHDLFAACWSSALLADGKVFVATDEGKLTILKQGKVLQVLAQINLGDSIYSTPVAANNVLYVATSTYLFAIAK